MRSTVIGFAAGVGVLQQQAQLPGWPVLLVLSGALIALLCWQRGGRACRAHFVKPERQFSLPGMQTTQAVSPGAAARRKRRLAFLFPLISWFSGLPPAWRRLSLCVVTGAACGFLWATLLAQQRLDDVLPLEWEGRDITVVGTVASLPDRVEQGVRFLFLVDQVVAQDRAQSGTQDRPQAGTQNPVRGGAHAAVPPRISLAWYRDRNARGLAPMVAPGSRWQFTVRLKRPHGNANPDGFDYEVWLLEQGVRAIGYVRGAPGAQGNRLLQAFVWTPHNLVQRWRAALRDRILQALPKQRYAGVLVALVIGDQRAIAQADWDIFNRTGIGHLISISGLHVTMVAGLFGALAGALWRRSFFTRAALPLRLPAQKAAILATLLAAWLYVLLAGFGVPAQRTLYMLMGAGAALWSGRLVGMPTALCAALAVVLVLDPWAVLWPGFWLSFGAVALILFASLGRTQKLAEPEQAPPSGWRAWRAVCWRGLQAAARTQTIVTLGLLPLTMLLFGQYSLVGPAANALAIPLMTLLVAPLALAGSIAPAPLAAWLLQGAHAAVAWLATLLEWLAAFPLAVWRAPLPSWWMFAAALAGALLLLAPRGWPLRWLGWLGWVPLLAHAPSAPPEGRLWITAFDVGQGMALLIETPRHRLLYDTGPAYSADSDGGSRVLAPYLRARGITRLDALVVSHSDIDHAGGALSLLREISVDKTWSSLSPASKIASAAPSHERCVAGQRWQWDGVDFAMLHPSPPIYADENGAPNARSCVLKVSIGDQAILLPGDIEAPQEAALLDHPDALRASVLVAPHHGSGTSSTEAFLRAVQPRLVLFQVGYRNRFRHPKEEIYQRYGQLGIARARSDEAGAVRVELSADALSWSEYRRQRPRYWHGL